LKCHFISRGKKGVDKDTEKQGRCLKKAPIKKLENENEKNEANLNALQPLTEIPVSLLRMTWRR